MQVGAAQFLGRDLLAQCHRSDLGAGHREGGITPHHGEIRQHRIPGAHSIAGAQHGTDPGHVPLAVGAAELADAAHPHRALDVGHAGARRFDQEGTGDADARGAVLQVAQLADVDQRRRGAQRGQVERGHRHHAPCHLAEAGDDAVGRRAVLVFRPHRMGELAHLDEAAGVAQQVDAFTGVEDAALSPGLQLGRAAHAVHGATAGVQVVLCCLRVAVNRDGRHFNPPCPVGPAPAPPGARV